MERMLVVVFDDESKAYEGLRALKQLDTEESITIHAASVLGKSADGTVTIKRSEDDFPIRAIGGTAIGSLIGLLGGPVGLALGAATGALAGSLDELNTAGVNAEYIGDVSTTLAPGKCAVVADVSEEWVTPVDAGMEALGGVVLRTARRSVEDDQRTREVAELRAEVDQLKAELAQASADRKAKLQAKIDQTNATLQAKLDQARQRSEQVRSEAEAKVDALRARIGKAQGDIKATLDSRVAQIRHDYQQSEAKLKHLLAAELRGAAAGLER